MPLVLDPERWTAERLRSEVEKHLQGLERLSAAMETRRDGSLNPYALDAGLALVRRATELGRALVEDSGVDRRLLVSELNVLYEVLAGLPYFLRAASELPRPPPSPPPATS